MKYRITVDEVIDTMDEKYPRYNEIYQQEVKSLDVAKLVTNINQTT